MIRRLVPLGYSQQLVNLAYDKTGNFSVSMTYQRTILCYGNQNGLVSDYFLALEQCLLFLY